MLKPETMRYGPVITISLVIVGKARCTDDVLAVENESPELQNVVILPARCAVIMQIRVDAKSKRMATAPLLPAIPESPV